MSEPIRPFPRRCGTCRQKTVHPAVLQRYQVELNHDGRTYPIDLCELPAYRCESCSNISFDDEADERISQALRTAAGLLQPAEIRAKREALGLTQKQLAASLRIAESTISRWESGAQIQQRAMDLLLRAYFDLGTLREYVGQPVAAAEEVVVSA